VAAVVSPRAVVLALAAAVLGAAPASSHPGYLPPFLDRAPEVGDRWLYASEAITASWGVEVVEVSAEPGGWRYVIEEHFDPGLGVPEARVEWQLRNDGSIWRGQTLWRGELYGPRKPLLVVAALPTSALERVRFGHVGWRGGKRRGWIGLQPRGSVYGSPPLLPLWFRLGDRGRPTLTVTYDPDLGRVHWTDRHGVDWELVSAVVGGVAYPP
jgi:hypothetical protein